jgi:hypothetical protein
MSPASALEIHARLLTEPPLWCAEVRDTATRQVLWSSWTDDWSAYATLEEAVRRADEVVAHLSAPRSARVA